MIYALESVSTKIKWRFIALCKLRLKGFPTTREFLFNIYRKKTATTFKQLYPIPEIQLASKYIYIYTYTHILKCVPCIVEK